jgi:hypothetical protein
MRTELLNPKDHGTLRVRSANGSVPHFVQIVTAEFAAASASCPVLISKDATTGEFYVGALFGFQPGECLKPDAQERGGFVPLNVIREGFFISGENIAIDRDNPRFSELHGDHLFEDGQPSVRLRQVQKALGELHSGTERTARYLRSLESNRLIEPIDVSLRFDSGETLSLQGLYTVSLDALRQLPDAQALELFRSGHLQLAYTMNASLNQIAILAQLRNQKLAQL